MCYYKFYIFIPAFMNGGYTRARRFKLISDSSSKTPQREERHTLSPQQYLHRGYYINILLNVSPRSDRRRWVKAICIVMPRYKLGKPSSLRSSSRVVGPPLVRIYARRILALQYRLQLARDLLLWAEKSFRSSSAPPIRQLPQRQLQDRD